MLVLVIVMSSCENMSDPSMIVLEYGTGCLRLESAAIAVATAFVHKYFLNSSSCTALSDRTLTLKLTSVSSRHDRYLFVTDSASFWASD
jgi:hypothetical protein